MRIEAFLVLCEDQYETRYGDGYFAYFAAAFPTRAEADAFIAANAKPLVGYHVRTATLTSDAGAWSISAQLEAGERVDTNGDGVKTDWTAVARAMLAAR